MSRFPTNHLLVPAIVALLAGIVAPGCGGSRTTDPGQPVAVEAPLETPTGGIVEGPEHEGSTEEPGGDVQGDPEDVPSLVLSDDACESDADCVPAACCHAAACVGRANAPDCSDSMCTMECRYGTLDCGGGCLCHEGRCAARLSEPPAMLPRE